MTKSSNVIGLGYASKDKLLMLGLSDEFFTSDQNKIKVKNIIQDLISSAWKEHNDLSKDVCVPFLVILEHKEYEVDLPKNIGHITVEFANMKLKKDKINLAIKNIDRSKPVLTYDLLESVFDAMKDSMFKRDLDEILIDKKFSQDLDIIFPKQND